MNKKNDCLQYNFPARNFNEALPIGNGTLGGMVYGNFPNECITLNLDTLWSGVPHRYIAKDAYRAWCDAKEQLKCGKLDLCEKILEERFTVPFTAAYLPLGTLRICRGDGNETEKQMNYSRKLDMGQGIAYSEADGWKASYLASFSDRCIAVSYKFEISTDLCIAIDSELHGKSDECDGCLVFIGQCPVKVEDGKKPVYNGRGIRFACAIGVNTDGDAHVNHDKISITGATYCDLFLTAESSFKNYNDIHKTGYIESAVELVKNAKKAGFASIFERQKEYYRKWFGQIQIDLGDMPQTDDTLQNLQSDIKKNDLVELLFHYGRYLTIAASAPGSQAMNLQGIWNDKLHPAWRSNYTVNINTEMNYWPAMTCGLQPFMMPLVDLVRKISDTGRTTAKQYYHAHGFVCHHNIDLWGNTAPVGGSGEFFIPGNSCFSYFNGASGWLCRNLYDYYEYTKDKEYLEKTAYPLMKSAAEFYLDILQDVDGRLAVSPATSPENQFVNESGVHAIGNWTVIMQSIVLDLFRNCVQCCEILQIDAKLKERLLQVIPLLKPFGQKQDGAMLEWDCEVQERDPNHRHVSNLYGLYPGELITTESTPDLAEACRLTLEHRGDDGTGWSLAWKACLWAKLKDGNHAFELIGRQLKLIDSGYDNCDLRGGGTYPNLLCAHPPFQIDGNFGITSAIVMLFLQCEDGKLKLLPALPDKIPHGEVSGLIAKGGVRISIKWTNKRMTEVALLSETEQIALVEYNGKTVSVALQPGVEKRLSIKSFD